MTVALILFGALILMGIWDLTRPTSPCAPSWPRTNRFKFESLEGFRNRQSDDNSDVEPAMMR